MVVLIGRQGACLGAPTSSLASMALCCGEKRGASDMNPSHQYGSPAPTSHADLPHRNLNTHPHSWDRAHTTHS